MTYSIREARETDAPGIARVHVDAWRSTYEGIVPDEVLRGLDYDDRAEIWRAVTSDVEPGRSVLIAEVEAEIAGFAAAGRSRTKDLRYEAELYAIYVLEVQQGRGIGRALTQAVAEDLMASGMSSLLVWVLADNPHRKFYAHLGGRLVAEKLIELGGSRLREVAYGWDDLSTAQFMMGAG